MVVRRAAVAAALLALLLTPAAARADGDPASDVLLVQSAYLPYQPRVSKSVAVDLNRVLGSARRVGFATRVAVIATPTDLGAVPDLFGKPQEYAKFLDRELRLVYPKRKFTLLVVMPAGFGVVGPGATAAGRDELRGIELSSGSTSDPLALAASIGTEKLARAAGRPMPIIVPYSRLGGGGGLSTHALIILLEVLGLAGGVAAAVTVRRRRALAQAAG